MLTFDPQISLALWFPLAMAAAMLMALYASSLVRRIAPARAAWIVSLMAVSVAIPLVILLNPMWIDRVPPPPGRSLVTVLIDRSASMQTADTLEERSRFSAAVQFVQRLDQRMAGRYEVRYRALAEDLQPVSIDMLPGLAADGDSTDLVTALELAVGEDRPQGHAVVLVSDGIDTSGARTGQLLAAADRAKAMGVPILPYTVGTQESVRDLDVGLHLSQELAFINQRVPVPVQLHSRGLRPGETTELVLSREGEVIERREVTLPEEGTLEELFYVTQDAEGLYRYEVVAEALEGEITDLNNSATLLLRVVDQPVRVLLLEGKPYWDTKFLVRTLSADPSIDITTIVQLAPGRLLERRIARRVNVDADAHEEASGETEVGRAGDAEPLGVGGESGAGNPPQPHRLEADPGWQMHTDVPNPLARPDLLEPYQILVLGRDTEAFLTQQALMQLSRWLQSGDGSLVCFRGPPASPMSQRLAGLMPVRWKPGREIRFRAELTGSGEALYWLPRSAASLAALPSLAAMALPEQPHPLTTVLAVQAGADDDSLTPLITYRPEGNGRVVVVEGAGMWRWAFLAPDHQQHDEVYGSLWRSLVRWLVSQVGLLPGERLSLRPDAVRFRVTQPVTATLLLREDQWSEPPLVELEGAELDEPLRATPILQADAPGVFHLNFGRLPEGRYRVRVRGLADGEPSAATVVEVIGNLQERLEIVARPDVMQQLAERSGGVVLQSDDVERLDRVVQRRLARSRPDRLVRAAAWDRWWILLAAFGFWAATWSLRRRSGLV